MRGLSALTLGSGPIHRNSVELFVAMLDDQLQILRRRVEGLSIEDLEWQPTTGCNTIGMLLAHLAIGEAYWVQVAARGVENEKEGEEIVRSILGIGIDGDGIPLAADGGHPAELDGLGVAEYFELLERARLASRRVWEDWSGESLGVTWRWEGRRISRGWVLYHLLEHSAYHLGQIGQLRALRERLQS